jgi:hypothetical protein
MKERNYGYQGVGCVALGGKGSGKGEKEKGREGTLRMGRGYSG